MMRKIFLALGMFIFIYSAALQFPISAHAQQEIPSYAKWSRLAIKETQLKYPNANIIDYLHKGSESKKDSTFETFKLWLRDHHNNEFGVFVRVEYNTKTDSLINIEFQETSR